MKKALRVGRLVLANQLKSLWRTYGPKKPYKNPGTIALVIHYILAIVFLTNVAFVLYRRIEDIAPGSFNPRPPENHVVSLAGDFLAAILTVYLLTQYFRQKLVTIPPDLEFLLYQPIQPWEIYAGVLIGLCTYFAVVFLPLVVGLLLVLPWLGFAVLYFFAYMILADPVLYVVSSIARRSGHSGTVLSLSLAYVTAGAIHSIVATLSSGWPTISPLLTYPVRGLYDLSLALGDLLSYASIPVLVVIAATASLLVVSVIGRKLDIDDFATLSEVYDVRLRRALRKSLKREVLTDWSSTAEALRRVVLEFTVYSPRTVFRRYLPVLTALTATGYAVRLLLLSFGIVVSSGQAPDFVAFLAYSMVPAAIMGFLTEILANDFKCLWVIRVYLVNPEPFTKLLIVKYSVTYLVAVIAVTGFAASYRLSPLVLLAPIVVLPVIIASVFTTLLASLLFAKRAGHYEPATEIYKTGGLPVLDPLSQLIMLPVLLLSLVSSLAAAVVSELIYTGVLDPIVTAVSVLASVVASYPLTGLFSRILAKSLIRVDIHF